MNLDTLEKLADAAINTGHQYDRDMLSAAANPVTIKALIALVRMQHEALVKDSFGVMGVATQKALAAYERFDKGE